VEIKKYIPTAPIALCEVTRRIIERIFSTLLGILSGFVNIIGPPLHHLSAFRQVLGMVVSGPDGVPLVMAMHERFEKQIEEGLAAIQKACGKSPQDPVKIAQRLGRLLGQNTRAAGAFKTNIQTDEQGHAVFTWEKVELWRSWSRLSEGCYLLRSNVSDWPADELWRAYIQPDQDGGCDDEDAVWENPS
jgi:hypothetical protein